MNHAPFAYEPEAARFRLELLIGYGASLTADEVACARIAYRDGSEGAERERLIAAQMFDELLAWHKDLRELVEEAIEKHWQAERESERDRQSELFDGNNVAPWLGSHGP